MKNLWLGIILLSTSWALAHKPVKVQTLKDAVAKYTNDPPEFKDWSGYQGTHFLKAIAVAEVGDLRLFRFEVEADWGPIQGMVAIKDGQVTGLEILLYTEHKGPGVTMPVFLDQFKALTLKNHQDASIKPLPMQPKTSLALKEVIDTIFSDYRDEP